MQRQRVNPHTRRVLRVCMAAGAIAILAFVLLALVQDPARAQFVQSPQDQFQGDLHESFPYFMLPQQPGGPVTNHYHYYNGRNQAEPDLRGRPQVPAPSCEKACQVLQNDLRTLSRRVNDMNRLVDDLRHELHQLQYRKACEWSNSDKKVTLFVPDGWTLHDCFDHNAKLDLGRGATMAAICHSISPMVPHDAAPWEGMPYHTHSSARGASFTSHPTDANLPVDNRCQWMVRR